MKNKRGIQLLVILVFLVPLLVYAAINWYDREINKLPVLGPPSTSKGTTSKEHTISDFNLTNEDGQPISTSDWKNKIVIVDFFFSHCPSICPAMTNNLKKVARAFKNDDDILINSFTVDPIRDSAAQLKSFSRRMNIDNSNWHLITGEKKEIYRLARNSFFIVATDGDGGPGDFIHSEKLVLIDKQKRIRGYYEGTDEKEVQRLIHDIKKLKAEEQ